MPTTTSPQPSQFPYAQPSATSGQPVGLVPPTPEVARAFFDQLDRVSAVVRYRIAGTYDLAPYGRPAYSASPLPSLPRSVDGMPAGVVVHYTASATLASAVDWFCRPELKSGRAAHWVVAQGKDKVVSDAELAMYPLVAQLPALPVQCRKPTQAGVHATWANGAFAGIEIVNLGNDLAAGRGKGRNTRSAAGQMWEVYTEAQIVTAAYIVACLRCLAPNIGLDMILGHEHVQSIQTVDVNVDKRDPGPLFPWERFRQLVRLPSDAQLPTLDDTRPPWELGMALLGYGDAVPSEMARRVFQYMSGLVVDGQVGAKTQEAVLARLIDRRGIAGSGITTASLPTLWRARTETATN